MTGETMIAIATHIDTQRSLYGSVCRGLRFAAVAVACAGLLLVTDANTNRAHAAEAPDALIQATTETVLKEFATRRDELKADSSKLYALVSDEVLPKMDFTRMSKMVLAQNWRKADDAQRERFTDAFKLLLVRTYASALFEYSGQPIEYKPLSMAADADDATVKTSIDPGSGPKIPLNYSLAKGESGEWRVYDVSIDGISLVTNYRSSYSRQIKKNGIDGLIKLLEKKNAQMGG